MQTLLFSRQDFRFPANGGLDFCPSYFLKAPTNHCIFFSPNFSRSLMVGRLIKVLLLQLLFLVASTRTGSSSTTDDYCPSSIYEKMLIDSVVFGSWTDHFVNSEGAIEFPVFHKNHPCIRSLGGSPSRPPLPEAAVVGSMMSTQMDISIDMIEDSTINKFAFLMPIKLGTPSVMNLVAIDTGSTLSWVQCRPCSIKCHNQSVKAGPIFDPSKSKTFRRVRCSSLDCLEIKHALRLQLANCMEKEDSCLYSMTYGDGWAYTVGKVGRDKLIVGNSKVLILDLLSSFSFFEQMTKLLSYKAFSYCLPPDETKKGYIALGDYNRDSVDGYTDLFPSSNRPTYSLMMDTFIANGQSLITTSSEMIVDSGSESTFLSSATFSRLAEVMTQAMVSLDYYRTYDRGDTGPICFQSRADLLNWRGFYTVFSNWSSLPSVEIGFIGTATLTLPPKNVFYNDPEKGLCMNFAQGDFLKAQILGNRVMRSFGTIFDIQGKRFGFQYAAC
ncbi:hypothetical protein ACP70R_035941 [Stipagrostis hirtigluma subsp. patula]